MLTNKQKMLLHVVPAKLGLSDEQRRTVQRNQGGFDSAADRTASHEGFVAVMAFYEHYAGGCLDGKTAGYWKAADDKNRNRGSGRSDRLLYAIRNQAGEMGWAEADVEAFLAGPHCSSGKATSLAGASEYWLSRCLDALKAIGNRKAM